ncbi:MAG: class I SAM-dependent methyltransferase [Candidatus Omnitrophica bacterium]|nr:class I SAM-dependent methyltransferase [Candidatus Omnitrophota bacterium]
MSRMKCILKYLLTRPWIARRLLALSLWTHNISYWASGFFASIVEADGLHPKHRLMNYHQWFMDHLRPEWRVLDVGCGNGALALDLSRCCKEVVGIDMSERSLQQAKQRAPQIRFIQGDAVQFVKKNQEGFDAVVLSNILEHVEARVDFLKNLSRVSPCLLIRVPMINRDWITLYKKERGLEWRLDRSHYTEYTIESFRSDLEQSGLTLFQYDIRFGEIYAVCYKK